MRVLCTDGCDAMSVRPGLLGNRCLCRLLGIYLPDDGDRESASDDEADADSETTFLGQLCTVSPDMSVGIRRRYGYKYFPSSGWLASESEHLSTRMSEPNRDNFRVGYSLEEMLFSFVLVFIREDFDAVREHLKPYFEPQGDKPPVGLESVIFQFENSEWTGFLCDQRCVASANELSRKLSRDCVVLQHDDCSSWTNFQEIHNGEVVEEYEFGFVNEEYRDAPVAGWQVVTSDADGGEFRFRSTLKTLEEGELRPADKFLDRVFRHLNLWCPDWGTISKLPDMPAVKAEAITIFW